MDATRSAEVVEEIDSHDVLWTNVNDMLAKDNRSAFCDLRPGDRSNVVRLSDFRFEIPVGSQISAIGMGMNRTSRSTIAFQSSYSLGLGGSIIGKTMTEGLWNGSYEEYYGEWNLGDWEHEWLVEELNNPEFALFIYVSCIEERDSANIDYIYLKVTYIDPTSNHCITTHGKLLYHPITKRIIVKK